MTPTCPAGIPTGDTGCAYLAVPLSTTGQSSHYIIQLPALTDFTGATISAVVIAPGALAGILQAYVQDGASGNYSPSFLGWKNLSSDSTWQTLSWNVNGTFNNTAIQYLGMSVESGGATSTSTFEQPATTIYIASITVTAGANTVYSINFGTSATVSQTLYATNKMWLNTNDGHVAGSSITWLSAQ